MNLEQKMLSELPEIIKKVNNGDSESLIHSLLIASGLKNKELINHYKEQIKQVNELICEQTIGLSDKAKAEIVYDYIISNYEFRINQPLITDMINGGSNCLGLTSLFTILCLKQGLNIELLNSGIHYFNRITINKSEVITDVYAGVCADIKFDDLIIEKTTDKIPEGKKLMAIDELNKEPLIRLVTEAYLWRAKPLFKEKKYEKALEYYEKALMIEPFFDRAVFYKARCKQELGYIEEAVNLFKKITNNLLKEKANYYLTN